MIVAFRRAHPGWGPRTILSKLRRELDEPPSRANRARSRRGAPGHRSSLRGEGARQWLRC
jgi:hypothetical protein